MKTHYLVDLSDFIRTDSAVLAGKDYGQSCRLETSLDNLSPRERVVVVVPDEVFAVTTSFFEGLFGYDIADRGVTGFRESFSFEGKEISHVVAHCLEAAQLSQ
jgi:hypothetical protein